ncbi:MAG: NUDIX domain-containing protein [Kiritimatiellia bacterium]
MIQDVQAPLVLFPPKTSPAAGDYTFSFQEERAALTAWAPDHTVATPLLSLGRTTFFLGTAPHIALEPLPKLRTLAPMSLRFGAFSALHLARWMLTHRYCGNCRAPMIHRQRCLQCATCGTTVFPTIAPAVIVGLIHNERLLITHYAEGAYQGPALVAGYCEVGETAENAVRRETQEETNLTVNALHYFGSQPWGLSGALLLGFFATVREPSVTLLDGELADAQWLPRSALPPPPPEGSMSLTGTMIQAFANGLTF